MRNKILKVMAIVFAVALITPSFAAVESVKVGGDITIKGIFREGTLLFNSDNPAQDFIYSGVRVYVTADLTDNIQAMIRLINERDFGNDYLREVEGSLLLDLGYIKVTDIITPGLTLTVGRQEIQLGNGLVVGSRYRAADYVGAELGTAAIDLGQQKAFDAIRADYEFPTVPIDLTLFKAKIGETYGLVRPTNDAINVINGLGLTIRGFPIPTIPNLPSFNDVDLYGLNMKYKGDMFTVEPYFVYAGMSHEDLDVMTGGVRGTINPTDALAIDLEIAKQFGNADLIAPGGDFDGMAGTLGLNYKFDVNMQPVVNFGFSYFSGWDGNGQDIETWIPVFPSNVASRIGSLAYLTLFPAGEGVAITGASGLQAFNLGCTIQPTEKIGVGLQWYYLTADEVAAGVDDSLGNEIDLSVSYAYTEDLSFGFDFGYLMAGDNIDDSFGIDSDNPWQVIGTMKLAF